MVGNPSFIRLRKGCLSERSCLCGGPRLRTIQIISKTCYLNDLHLREERISQHMIPSVLEYLGRFLVKAMAALLVATLLGLQGTDKKTAPSYRAESSANVIRCKDASTYVTENRSFRFTRKKRSWIAPSLPVSWMVHFNLRGQLGSNVQAFTVAFPFTPSTPSVPSLRKDSSNSNKAS